MCKLAIPNVGALAYQLLFAPLRIREVGSRALLGLSRCRSVRSALPSFLAVTLLGFNASSCSSDLLTKVCRASVKCLSRVRSGCLAFAAAAASQRRSPRRPAAVFTPSAPVLGHWELARSATSRAHSLLGCDLVLTRSFRFRSDAVYGRVALSAQNFAGVLCTPKVTWCRSRCCRRRLRRVAPLPS